MKTLRFSSLFPVALLSSALFSPLAFADSYTGTGSTPDAAREELARSIFVNIKSETETEINASSGFLSRFVKETKHNQKQQSNVILSGVVVTKTEDGDYLATLDKKQFRKDAEATSANLIKHCQNELPEIWQARRQILAQCLDDIEAAISMARGAHTDRNVTALNALRNDLVKYNDEALISISSTPEAAFSFDGQYYENSQTLRVASGEHKVIWSKDGYCSHETIFTIKAGAEKSLNHRLQNAPQITFLSPNLDAKLTVNGQPAVLGEVMNFEHCNDEIVSYAFSNKHDAKNGSIHLKPNLKRSIKVTLLTAEQKAAKLEKEERAKERKKRRQEKLAGYASSYNDLKALQLLYGYSMKSDFENTHRLRLEYVRNLSALRYGFGGMYGKGEESREYELYGQLALQLTDFAGTPLHIAGWAFIPYVGGEVGFGYHDRYKKTLGYTIHKFDTDSSFKQDRVVLRYLAGIDFPVSKQFSFKLQASKNTTMEESVELNAGINILF